MPINWFNKDTSKFRKPFTGINKKIHEATGKVFPGRVPPKTNVPMPGVNPRQVGKNPEMGSDFKVQHKG